MTHQTEPRRAGGASGAMVLSFPGRGDGRKNSFPASDRQANFRLRRHRQVLRLHRLGPIALARFIDALEAGADLPRTLSMHTGESRGFLDSLRQPLPFGRWRDRGGCYWLFDRYIPVWRKVVGEPPEAISGSRGEPWVSWTEQVWFYRNSPFLRTSASRALRRELEDVLHEFLSADPDGPVARRLIANWNAKRPLHALACARLWRGFARRADD